MSMNNDGWILMSERKPAEADLPTWVCDNGQIPSLYVSVVPGLKWDYWRPAAADIPAPPKEETQADKDVSAFGVWWNEPRNPSPFGSDVWHAALAYERAEVAKMLPAPDKAEYVYNVAAAIQAIRARCGGAK